MRKKPGLYGIELGAAARAAGGLVSEQQLEAYLKDRLILKNVQELAQYGMVGWLLLCYLPGAMLQCKTHRKRLQMV